MRGGERKRVQKGIEDGREKRRGDKRTGVKVCPFLGSHPLPSAGRYLGGQFDLTSPTPGISPRLLAIEPTRRQRVRSQHKGNVFRAEDGKAEVGHEGC